MSGRGNRERLGGCVDEGRWILFIKGGGVGVWVFVAWSLMVTLFGMTGVDCSVHPRSNFSLLFYFSPSALI